MNLRWSWHPETRDLFETLDPALWQRCGGDPVKVLGEVSAERLAALAKDRKFVRRLQDAVDDLEEYLDHAALVPVARAPRRRRASPTSPPEFGITEVLPQYSGGLGILAGDHLKAASDLGVPLIGVGLLYRAGYFAQSLSRRRLAARALPVARPARPAGEAAARGRRLGRRSSPCRCPRAGRCTRTSGGRRSAGCRCCCSTATSRRTRRPSAASPTGSTAATRTTGCARRCCSASAACGRCAPTAR